MSSFRLVVIGVRRGHVATLPVACWVVPPEPDQPGCVRVGPTLHLVVKHPVLSRHHSQLGVALAVCDDTKGGPHERTVSRGVGKRAFKPGPVHGGHVNINVLQHDLIGLDLRAQQRLVRVHTMVTRACGVSQAKPNLVDTNSQLDP